jgi:hypothetical protein
LYIGIDNTVCVRPKNLFFNPPALRRVRTSLGQLDLKAGSMKSITDFYDSFLSCFYDHGRESKPKLTSPRLEPWMSFLAADELEVEYLLHVKSH